MPDELCVVAIRCNATLRVRNSQRRGFCGGEQKCEKVLVSFPSSSCVDEYAKRCSVGALVSSGASGSVLAVGAGCVSGVSPCE